MSSCSFSKALNAIASCTAHTQHTLACCADCTSRRLSQLQRVRSAHVMHDSSTVWHAAATSCQRSSCAVTVSLLLQGTLPASRLPPPPDTVSHLSASPCSTNGECFSLLLRCLCDRRIGSTLLWASVGVGGGLLRAHASTLLTKAAGVRTG